MNQDIHYLQKPFITVGAVFEDHIDINDILNPDNDENFEFKGHCYTFKAEIDSGFQIGDYAVVHAQNELKVVKIVQVHHTPQIDINARFEYKWVIQRIDFNGFKQRHEEQKQLNKLLAELEIAERREALFKRLNQMAAKNPNIAAMLNDFTANQTITIPVDFSNNTD